MIDDGSSDNTLSVAQEYASRDDRVRVFHQDNAGVSVARNHGIREAHGEYFTCLDSDDWLEDNAIKILLETQQKYPDFLPVGGIYNVTIENRNFRRILRSKFTAKALNIPESIHTLFALVFANAPAKLFRTDLIRKYSLSYPQNIHYGEDRIFLFSYLQKTRGIALTSQPVVNVFLRNDSAIRMPYDERKIFTDEGFHDHAQVMIDNADTPELKDIFKLYHALQMVQELGNGLRNGISSRKFKALQQKAKIYASYLL